MREIAAGDGMVSFKNNNVDSEQTPPHRHLPGSLRGSLNYSHSHRHNHLYRNDSVLPPVYCTPPPPLSSNFPPAQRGCALHSRLDQPVTSSTSGMDSKKVVQAPPLPVPVQVRSKNDGTGVAASVSGVRRRSGSQGLRSPAAKRPLSAPVALQGWLHKQGSEGLMLWKKRWFVLSEYCLFYYKGPEEEKLLGSILLPSYRVTVCKPEDKVNRKFAFKAEHANMRTYHFAADSRESMNQWVNALTLATLLQDPSPGAGEASVVIEIGGQDGERSARPSVSSISSILNQSADDSDSGFHGFQSRDDPSHASNNNSSPNSVNTASFPNLSGSNGNSSVANNNNNTNNNNNNNNNSTSNSNNNNNNNSVTSNPGNNNSNEIQPMVNGWIQQQTPYPHQPSTSQHQQQQQQQQYGQIVATSQQIQQSHSHQHQALLHQHLSHQNQLHKQQQQQQSHLSASNVQTVQPMPRKFGQPIYANAPPKPRRLTDGSTEYSTPSPDPDYRKSPVSPDVTVASKSPMSDYDRGSVIYGTRMNQPSQQSLRTDKSGLNYGYGQVQTERRTPDTYGRSAAKPRSARGNGDYEEVYGAPPLYQRPAGPVGYTKGSSPAPIPIPIYAAQHQQYQQQIHSPAASANVPIMRQPRTQPPPRPHSADFLEYEAARKPQQQMPTQCEESLNQQRRPQRPKSSLDIVTPSDAANDGYFYSEERYAAQMRQSAVYLHQTPQHHQQQRNQSLSRATMPSKASAGLRDRCGDESRMATLPDAACGNVAGLRRPQREHVHQQHAMAHQSLQRHNEINSSEAKLRRSLREKSYEPSNREMLSHMADDATLPRRMPREYESLVVGWGGRAAGQPAGHVGQSCHAPHAAVRRWNEQQQFCRSASARLPRTRHPAALDPDDDDDYAERSSEQDSRDGERKIQQREESMKRLLEWKQRMLQSPLTRKPSASANRGGGRAQNELSSYYKQQALLELAAHEASVAESRHSRRREDGHRPHVRSKSTDGRRTVANVSRYNSYSSDDEELGDVRRKRTRRPPHAGRSPRQAGDSRSSANPPPDGRPCQNARRATSDRHETSAAAAGRSAHGLGGIPPDAGYEEVSFPSARESRHRAERSPPCLSPEQAGSGSRNDQRDSEPTSVDGDRFRKRPSGILKTSTAYGVEQNGRTTIGYGSETWSAQKNVQWTSKKENDNWDPSIDESKVVKEFSYQYIKPREEEEEEEESTNNDEKQETMNLVQCRIRSFELSMESSSPVKEVLTMQEPLKLSPLQATEAQVSRLDSTKKSSSVIRNFALGDADRSAASGGHAKQASTDSNKSVKDLLADFERKSQQVQRQEYGKRQEAKHRGVFSDSEALLYYDTGSDLDQRDKSDQSKNDGGEAKADQVVAQVLNGPEVCADSSQNTEDVCSEEKKSSGSKESVDHEVNSNEDMDTVSEPSCARLSVAESLLTHVDRFSDGTDNTEPTVKQEDVSPEEHYLPMSPRKAILDPNDDRPNPKMMETLFANLEHEESSYVEMAQNGMTRSLLAPVDKGRKHDSGDYSTLDTPHYEFVCVSDSKMEPVYMEVSQLSDKEENDCSSGSLKKKKRCHEDSPHSRTDLPDILTALKSDSSDADDESSKDLDSIDAPRHPRFSLSDTFRPASYYLGASRTMIAEMQDSSDSELVSPPPIPTSPPPLDDLDSLDMQDSLEIKKVSAQVAVTRENGSNRDSPRSWNKPMGQTETHRPPSRFSDATISSTFRDSRMSLESASGSDSVEPRTPEEEARHRQLKTRPVSEVCEVLDSLDELESLGSRFDGASIDLDQYLEELQARDAFNVDLYAKDLSYNSIYGFNENMMVVDKLRKSNRHELPGFGNLDQSLRYGAGNRMGSASSLPSMRVCDVPPSHQHSQSFTGDAHYENVTSFTPLRNSPAIRSENEQSRDVQRVQRGSQNNLLVASHSRDSSYSFASAAASVSTSMACQRPASARSSMHSPTGSISIGTHGTSILGNTSPYSEQRFHSHSRSASQDSARYSMVSNHRSSSSQDSSHYPSTVKPDPAPQSYLPNEPRPQSQQSAPYYYSDLQTSGSSALETESQKPIGHCSRLPQLNNQRDNVAGLNKRNDIGRIVNPIARQMPRQIQVDDIDEARRIAAELRKTTCFQLLGESKADLVDKKNFYEADTLRRVKSTDPLPDVSSAEISPRNLYPHGLRDKSSGNRDTFDPTPPTQASHRRSRSLEGLLDDAGLQQLVEQRNRSNRVATTVPQPSQVEETAQETVNVSGNHSRATENTFSTEDPWEQDSLWRESLRRVSLRNARSLDNLDSAPGPIGQQSASDAKVTRNKVTRGATYVNDSVILRRENSTEDWPRVKRRANKDRKDRNEDFNQQMVERRIHAGGYVWDARNEAYRKASLKDREHFLEEGNLPPVRLGTHQQAFELDREKLRQWDLLSSACLLQEQQRGSMADSGRGLPVATAIATAREGRPGDVPDATRMPNICSSTLATDRDIVPKLLDEGLQSSCSLSKGQGLTNETSRAAGEWLVRTSGVFRK